LGHHHFAADQHRAPCCAAPCPGRPCSAMSVGRRPSSGQPPSPPRQRLSTHAASPAATTITVASREVASRQPAPARWRRASRTCEVGVGVGLAGLLVHVLLSLCPYSSQANSINRCPLSHLPSMLFHVPLRSSVLLPRRVCLLLEYASNTLLDRAVQPTRCVHAASAGTTQHQLLGTDRHHLLCKNKTLLAHPLSAQEGFFVLLITPRAVQRHKKALMV